MCKNKEGQCVSKRKREKTAVEVYRKYLNM